jgi:hypothetical protein
MFGEEVLSRAEVLVFELCTSRFSRWSALYPHFAKKDYFCAPVRNHKSALHESERKLATAENNAIERLARSLRIKAIHTCFEHSTVFAGVGKKNKRLR